MDQHTDIAERMRALIQARDGVQKPTPEVAESPINETEIEEGLLPYLDEGEFLIDFHIDGERVVVGTKELAWPETLDIDAKCHKGSEKDYFYNGELDRRLTLSKAIRWVFDMSDQRLMSNKDGKILKRLAHPVVEEIHKQYIKRTVLSAEEASALYAAASKYFRNEAQDSAVVPPIVIMVDMMAEGVMSYSEKELMAMGTAKMDRINRVLSARAEALGLNRTRSEESPQATPPKPVDNPFAGRGFIGMPPR